MNRLLSIEEKLRIIDEIETIFVTGKGMPTSANDDIMKKLQALKTDQSERQVDVTGKVKDSLVNNIKSQFYIFHQLPQNQDGDVISTYLLEGVVSNHLSKLK